ncbi:MAG: dipeptidase [Desulfovibrionales bacterium]
MIPFPVVDGHVDLLYFLMQRFPRVPFDQVREGGLTRETFAQGNVRILASAHYIPDSYNGPGNSSWFLEQLLEYAKTYCPGLEVLRTREAVSAAVETAGLPGVIRLLENADALLEWDVEEFKTLGFLTVGLTHVGSNRVGDGNGVKTPRGLTPQGRTLVKALDRQGFVLDVAHLSEPAFAEVARIFSGPLLASHTGLRFFCNRVRNLSDDQVRVVMERGGIIGITVAPEMLTDSNKASVQTVYEHIDHLVDRYGPDQVALGTDFGGFDETCEGLETPGSFQNLAALLLERGYREEAVAGIMGGNWVRFYQQMLP